MPNFLVHLEDRDASEAAMVEAVKDAETAGAGYVMLEHLGLGKMRVHRIDPGRIILAPERKGSDA